MPAAFSKDSILVRRSFKEATYSSLPNTVSIKFYHLNLGKVAISKEIKNWKPDIPKHIPLIVLT
jgi:hypothetical protein